jgi:hypothetical protein
MEGKAEWHHKVPSAEQYEVALEQVGKQWAKNWKSSITGLFLLRL